MIYYLIMSHSCIVLLCFEIGSDDMDNGHGLRSPSLKNTAIYPPLSLYHRRRNRGPPFLVRGRDAGTRVLWGLEPSQLKNCGGLATQL